MKESKRTVFARLRRIAPFVAAVLLCVAPVSAHAAWGIVDALNLAPFVPLTLDALMTVATGGYEFFVGTAQNPGMIYLFVWGFLGISIALYLLKMYFPKTWLGFFGLSGGGSIDNPEKIGMNILKPGFRAIVAVTLLLQIKPVYLTEYLVNPFLQFGAVYTHAITESINDTGTSAPAVECPPEILAKGWISKSSCEFLVQPVSDLSVANNRIIKRGFEFLDRGLRGLMTLLPHGGEDFMNVITGILLIVTFVGSNLFMALLIIQGIFDFGMALILYPFSVLTYVVKSSDKWLDVWPAFSGITNALKKLIITMIACAFILCINLAVIRSLFNWNSSVFVVAAGGSASSNVPLVANTGMGFGEHSVTWMSAILTFYLMQRIFDETQKKLKTYTGGMDGLYNQVKGDTKTFVGGVKKLGTGIGKAVGWIKK